MSDTARALDRGPLEPGQRLGRYEVAAELAQGGMATVYLARATGLAGFDKLVALKCVHRRLAREPGFIEMFLDEARLASRITHPNVGSVFDVGEEAGIHYLAMDYLHGESLASVLGSVAMHPAARSTATYPVYVASIVASAAEGLHAAHELRGDRGAALMVVHRDVSPHNIFVTYDGAVRVVDFGIARAAGRLHKTLSGTIKGKVAYMSPEQLRGEELDRRTDIWALGVTLWELLTVRRLFKHESQGKTIDAVLGQEIPPPSRFAPFVPSELDAIVLRALARDPDDRYATSRDFDRDLRRFIGATGELVGMAELADFMEQLFADHRAAKQRMIEQARSGGVIADVPDTQRFAKPPPDLVPTAIDERSDIRPSKAREGMTTLPQGSMVEVRPQNDTIREVASPAALVAHEVAPVEAPPPPPAIEPFAGASRTESVVLPVRRASPAVMALGGLALLGLVALAIVVMNGSETDEDARPVGGAAADTTGARPASPPSMMSAPLAMDVPVALEVQAPEEETSGDTRPPAETGPEETAPSPRTRVERRSMRGPERALGEVPARAVPAPAVEEPVGEGAVTVGVRGGWGTIEVDGQDAGQSPRELRLRAGRHVVVVRPFGREPSIRRVVTVRAGETARLVIDAEEP